MVCFKESEWTGKKQCFFRFFSSFWAPRHKWGCGAGLEARDSVGKLRQCELALGFYFFGNPCLLLNAHNHNSPWTQASAENDLKTKSGTSIIWGEAQQFFLAQIRTPFYFNLMSEIWQDTGYSGSIKVTISFSLHKSSPMSHVSLTKWQTHSLAGEDQERHTFSTGAQVVEQDRP